MKDTISQLLYWAGINVWAIFTMIHRLEKSLKEKTWKQKKWFQFFKKEMVNRKKVWKESCTGIFMADDQYSAIRSKKFTLFLCRTCQQLHYIGGLETIYQNNCLKHSKFCSVVST